MSDLNFGDPTNRSNVKNPLLSTAVLGLSLEELNHRAVLLPAAPPPCLITGQDSTSHQQTQKQNIQPHNPIITSHPLPPPNLNHPPKTTETFDVNEYFARLEGTRYVSAPINAEIPDKTKLEAEEQNLEEVNLNEAIEDSYQQSITADIAQNFSQLPNVLPQMASAVFSSFSNMLNMSKKEVAEVQSYNDEGFKKVDLNADDLVGEAVKKDVPPPPKESSIGSTANTYRITTKKKAYAHIPGLSSNQPVPIQNNAFNPPPSQLHHNYFNPNNIPPNNPANTHQNEANNATTIRPGVDTNVINIFDQNQPNQMNNPGADYLESLVKSEINANVFNVQHTPADQHAESSKITSDISRDVTYGQQPFGAQDANPLFRPPQVYNPTTLQNQMDTATAISKPPMTITSEHNLNATATPIIPPPTMFSSPTKAEANVTRSILPPSVANRLGRNRPVVRNTPAAAAVEANIFVPTPLSESNPNEALAASFPPPPLVPGFSGTNVMHAPSSVYAPPNMTSSTHNIFTPTFDGTKLESSSISAFATTAQNITGAGLNRQVNDPIASAITSIDAPINYTVQGGLTESNPVPNQNIVEVPKQYDNSAHPPMRFDPAEIIKPIVEPPKPVPEPPKLPAANVNFRLNKKRPQYYSGPIEGVGAISNNFKPIIGPTDTNTSQSTFHGALFTPPVSFSDVNTQVNQDVQSTVLTPNYHHITPSIAAQKRDLNEPTAYDYRYEHQQTQNIVQNPVDYSTQTTDYYDESKTENKGFGIIGSLKSKLSAIDINKIQNTVTTFFDPAYNDGVKKESVTDDNDSYRSQSNPSNAGDNSSLEIFVPSMDASPRNQQPDDPQNGDYRSQYSTYFGNNNLTNQGHYKTQNESYQEQQFYTGSYYTENLSENNPSNVANAYTNVGPTVGFDSTTPLSAEHSYIPVNVQNQNIDVCAMAMARQQNEANAYNATGFVAQEQNEPLHSAFQGNIEEYKQRDNVDTINQTESLSSDKFAHLQMINPLDFFNQHHDDQGTFKSDNLQQNIYSDPLPSTSNINKHENVKSNMEDVSAFFDKEQVESPLTASGFFNKNEGQNLSDAESRRNSTYVDDKTTLQSVSLGSRVEPNPVSPSTSVSTSDFLMQSVKESEVKSTTSSDFVSPFNISATPLMNLSTLLAEKSMTQELEAPVGSFSRSRDIIDPNDKDEFDNSQIPVVMSDSVKEIDICETCREVYKEDDSDNDEGIDLTTQLIKNIISPIQLHNPVGAPFLEANEISNNSSLFDADQSSQVSLMTTSTIGAIHGGSVTDLIDDEDIEQFDKTLKITSGLIGEDCATPYGWKQSSQLGQDSNNIQKSAFSFQPNVSAIGFYGDNSVFFDQTPKNPGDALIAGLNLNTLSQNIVMSEPSAPKMEDIDDTTGDMTEGIDVQLIEQDAKTDFEEFVVEPPERDDDMICKGKENSKDAVNDTSSFTERVEEFKSHEISSEDVFPPNNLSNLKQSVLRTEFTSPTTIASYFDTGNYAADAHYRKSVTSPSSASSFEVGSPKQSTAMASVTTSNIQILPSIIPPNEKDDNSIQVPLTKGIFTLESLSDQRIDSTVGLTGSSQAVPISSAAHTDISNIEMSNVFPDLIRDTKQSGDCVPQYNMPDFSTNITSNPIVEASVTEANVSVVTAFKDKIETSIDNVAAPKISQIIKPQPIAGLAQHKFEDPMAFFQTEPKIEQSEGSCNRLASYFSSPPKSEQSKSFFELSQSQNHLRQNPETNKKEYKTFYELSQAKVHEKVQPPIGGNQADVKVTPFNLFKDLTSLDNYTPTEEQTTRQVNYFTVEYDLVKKNLNRENNIGEPDVKAAGCSKNMDDNDNTHKNTENIDFNKVNKINHPNFSSGETSNINENIPKNAKDELKTETQVPKNEFEESDSKNIEDICFLDVIKACKKCNSLFSDHLDRVSLGNQQVFKLRKAMDTESKTKPAQGDVSADSTNDHLKMSFEYIEDENEDEKFSIITDENRQNTEYVPVKYHWFYRVDNQGKSVWRGFSTPDSQALEEAHNSPSLDENTLVPTDGGRFDVNVMGRLRVAVYWDEKPTNVRRCSWFYKGTTDARYVPYTESVAERLEEEYRKGVTTGTWHRRLVLSNNEAVIMHTPSVCVHIPHSSPAERTSHRQSTMRPRVVRRGIEESEIEDTAPSRIDHLLLLCHGVGSACDMKFRSVEQVVDDFRMTSVQLIQAHYKSAFENGDIGRIEVLPIAWHSSLHSGESGVDKRLSMITLDSIPLVRSFTNDAVLDVLFYTSPKYCQTIIDTVCAEMNRIYTLFMSRNHNFYGGVSLGGHSLGSVILYDLLCHQTPILPQLNHTESLSFTRHLHTGTAGTGQPQVKYPQLVFHPCAFYALGSPIAIFECIRGVDELGEDFVLPTCPKFYNIFHPYDPIAYRIEPLLNPRFKDIPPLLIPHHKGRKRMHLELKETMARVGADLKQKLLESIKTTWSNMWKTDVNTQQRLEKVVEEEIEKEALNQEETGDITVVIDEKAEKLIAGRLNGGRRVDHVLQEAPLEMINEYLFAMSSHVCYWESEDTMLLILREVYDALGIQPDTTVPQQTMTVQRETGLKDDKNNDEIDLPSTSSA